MKLSNSVFILCCLLCLQIDPAHAAAAHTVRGVVITPEGTVVPEFSVVVRHVANKPELFERKHFKNGEFTVTGLKDDKYQLHVSSAKFIGARLDFDFKGEPRPIDYCIVILHSFRNEARLAPGRAYSVSVRTLQEKVPDAAREAYRKGVDLHRGGQLEEAIVEYGRALRTYPQYLEALSDLGTIFILFNKPDSALTFLKRAQGMDDCNPIINLNVAVALTEQGAYGDALKLLRRALRYEPRMALAHFYIGRIHYLEKKYAEAEEEVRQAVESDPGLLDAWLLMIHLSIEQKKYDQARDGLQHIRQGMHNGKVTKLIDEQLAMLGS